MNKNVYLSYYKMKMDFSIIKKWILNSCKYDNKLMCYFYKLKILQKIYKYKTINWDL